MTTQTAPPDWLARMDRIEDRLDEKIVHLDTRIDRLDEKLEAKIDLLDQKLDAKIDHLDTKIDGVSKEIVQLYRTILFGGGAIVAAILGVGIPSVLG